MNLKKVFFSLESFIFIISQVLAGGLNYLFQVYASKTLSVVDFGSWSHWLAQFSVACFVGVWFQSLAALGNVEAYFDLKRSRWFLLVIFLGLIFSMSMQWIWSSFIFGWICSLLSGYWVGLLLRAQNMKMLALASVSGAVSRFVWVLFDNGSGAFYRATLIAPFFMCAVVMLLPRLRQKVANEEKSRMTVQVGAAALGLAFFSAWIPQVDLLMASKFISATELGILAKVSLLNKACFFGFQILAQLLLAHQVQAKRETFGNKHFLLLGCGGVLVAMISGGVAQVLGWPVAWAFLSLLHVTTLCLLFLCVQDLSARHRGREVLVLCLASVIMALTGVELQRGLEVYWLLVTGGEFAVLLWFIPRRAEKQDLTNNQEYVTIKE